MIEFHDRSEEPALKLSDEARASLTASNFKRVGWYLETSTDSVTAELLAEKAIRQTPNGLLLTNRGMILRALAVRLARRQRISSTIAPDRRN
jgi:hypothetical protein